MQKLDVKGRHVLLVEDIVDTGGTALKLQRLLLAAGAASVRLVALLDKAERRTVDLTPDYVCFRARLPPAPSVRIPHACKPSRTAASRCARRRSVASSQLPPHICTSEFPVPAAQRSCHFAQSAVPGSHSTTLGS